MKHFIKALSTLAIIAFPLMGCNHQKTGDERTEAEFARLQTVTDSVLALTPRASALVDSALAHTEDSLNYYDYYVKKGFLFLMGQSDSVLHVSNRILHFAQRLPQTPRAKGLLAQAYNLRANYFFHNHKEHDEVLEYNLKSYHLVMESDIIYQAPYICANIGDNYIIQSLLPDAATWYRRALVISDSLGVPKEKNCSLYMGLGHIYCLLNDFDLSEEYYAKAMEEADKLEANMKFNLFNNYGNLQYYKGDYDKALSVFLQLDSLINRYGLKGGFEDNLCRLNMADVYLNLGKTQESMQCLEPADSFFRKYGVGDGIYYANTIRIGNILKTGNVSRISDIIKGEPPRLTTDENMIDIRNKYLHDYYASVGDRQRAAHYEQITLARKDSIDKSRQHMRASDVMMRLAMDTLALHNQLRIEEKNAEMSKAKYTYTLIIGGILMLALGLLAWILFLRKRNADKRMEIIQLKIANTRNSINPHFIFNILNHATSKSDESHDKAIGGIAELMRSQLKIAKQMFVPLREELDFVERYLEVVAPTMGEDFTYTITRLADECQDNRLVPSTFVQILAENAIKHGLRGIDHDKTLTIDTIVTDTDTTITVTDNGRGFDIRSSSSGTGTGLNVIKRTTALINHNSRQKLTFSIDNIKAADGNIHGCRATLSFPTSLGQK
ncbi:MAG: histidine kinase [Prevotella sp.]|nr:histidine kinase [Prevotella sp.]